MRVSHIFLMILTEFFKNKDALLHSKALPDMFQTDEELELGNHEL